MPRSTASFIAYDIRPAKQIERRGVAEFLNCAKHAGFNISNYRYVGFGGTKFVDFQLMDRYVGFRKYHSIEHDENIFDRCKFNRPLNSIEMFNGPLSVFLSTDEAQENSVYWLDFEISISSNLFSDINSIAAKMKDGDILLTTISAEAPSRTDDRKQLLKSRIPSLKATIDRFKPKQLTDKSYPETVGALLLAMFKSAFSSRLSDGQFHPIFKVIYKDSVWMCTVGGVFTSANSKRAGRIKRAVAISLSPMCPKRTFEFYRMPHFNFTQLERLLLEKSVISQNIGYTRRLVCLGLDRSDLEAYSKVSRFIPKFVESAY